METSRDSVREIVAFWVEAVGPKGWYNPTDALDETIRERFEPLWEKGRDGFLAKWLCDAEGTLAYSILLDQFPRNMFRGSGKSFATDGAALAGVKIGVDRNWDLRIDEPQRQFFYLPMMHSERLADQERCVRLIKERMPEGGAENLLHAKAHREVIRRFGRFPHRNEALLRESTPAETAFLEEGGYGAVVRKLQDG